jgi:hypothetical protein
MAVSREIRDVTDGFAFHGYHGIVIELRDPCCVAFIMCHGAHGIIMQ